MYSPEPSITSSNTLVIRGQLLQITPFKYNLPDTKSGMLARSDTWPNPMKAGNQQGWCSHRFKNIKLQRQQMITPQI